MMVAGVWLRPAYYGAHRNAADRGEVRNCRDNVGLIVSIARRLRHPGP